MFIPETQLEVRSGNKYDFFMAFLCWSLYKAVTADNGKYWIASAHVHIISFGLTVSFMGLTFLNVMCPWDSLFSSVKILAQTLQWILEEV